MLIPALMGVTGILMAITMWRPALTLGIQDKALNYSIAASAGSLIWQFGDESCTKVKQGSYVCGVIVPDPANDSSFPEVQYAVTVGRTGCWVAERKRKGHDFAPARLSDCLGVRDYYRPFGRAFGG